MTFSYSGDPANSDLDAVRYLIGDTSPTGALVTDEEIQYSIDRWFKLYGTLEWVASEVMLALSSRYAREASSISADGVSVSLSGLADEFAAQSERLRQMHRDSFVGAQPDVGGISPDEGSDPLVKPFAFEKGLHDNTTAGQQDFGGDNVPQFPAERFPGT